MAWTKYNNPYTKKRKKKVKYSDKYIEEQKMNLVELLSSAKTDKRKEFLIDASSITINP